MAGLGLFDPVHGERADRVGHIVLGNRHHDFPILAGGWISPAGGDNKADIAGLTTYACRQPERGF